MTSHCKKTHITVDLEINCSGIYAIPVRLSSAQYYLLKKLSLSTVHRNLLSLVFIPRPFS